MLYEKFAFAHDDWHNERNAENKIEVKKKDNVYALDFYVYFFFHPRNWNVTIRYTKSVQNERGKKGERTHAKKE